MTKTKLCKQKELLKTVAASMSVSFVCLIYAKCGSNIYYHVNLRLRTEDENAFATTDEVFTRQVIYGASSLIRVLSKEMLKNIIVNNEEDCPHKTFLVYRCGKNTCGGWGDREKGIISSFLLALLTNRTFVIYINKPCDIEYFIGPFIYNWTICKRFLNTISASNTSEETHVISSRRFYYDIHSIDFKTRWPQQVVFISMNAYEPLMSGIKKHKDAEKQLKWIMNKTNPEIVHLILHTLFKPKQRLVVHLRHYIANITHGRQLVCSHIRKGKNPSIPGDRDLLKGIPKEQTMFSFLQKYNNINKYVIYIATDSDDVRNKAMTKFRNIVNINRTIIHVDRFETTEQTIDLCEGLYTVLFEQKLLSLCDTLLLTRSNFGTNAAYMRGISENLFLYQTEEDEIIQTNLTYIQTIYGFV